MDSRIELLDGVLARCRLGKPLLIMEEVVSTNDALKDLAEAGAEEGCTVLADRQSGGRGRMGRQWLSPGGKGVYMSVLLRPSKWPASDSPVVGLLAALAVARALKRAGLAGVELKWPNDILVRERKIAGILAEPAVRAGIMDYCVVGAGVNVSHDEGDLCSIGGRATSCRMEGLNADGDAILVMVLEELDYCYSRAVRGERGWIPGEWAGCAVASPREPRIGNKCDGIIHHRG